MFLAVILVPELFKKLRETPGNNFHQVSSKSNPGCPSNLMLSHNLAGGLHDLQILSWENVIEFSQDPGSELVGFGRNLVEIVPRSLPELFKQLRDQNNSQKQSKTSDNILREK